MKKCIQTLPTPQKKIYFSDRTSEKKRGKVISIKWGLLTRNRPINHAICISASFSFPEGTCICCSLGDAK